MNNLLYTLPTPTLQQCLNVYSAYSYFGIKSVPLLATTSFVDGVLAKYTGSTKHYAGLTAFWGSIAYKAISNLNENNYVPDEYKLFLQSFFALSAVGLVWKGQDFLNNNNQNIGQTLESIKVAAKLFDDEDQTISIIEKSFEESNTSGLYTMATHIAPLLSNKFISNLLKQQGINIIKMIILEKYLNSISPTSKLSLYYASQKEDGFNTVMKGILLNFSKLILNNISNNLIQKLDIEKDISIKVSELVFNDANTSSIIKLGKNVETFSSDIKNTIQNANDALTQLSKSIITPLMHINTNLNANTNLDYDMPSLINHYPNLILLEHLVYLIGYKQHGKEILQFIEKQFTTSHISEEIGVAKVTQTCGGVQLTITSNSQQYAYQHVQDIAISGANEFMRHQVCEYIKHKQDGEPKNMLLSEEILNTIVGYINDALFYSLLPSFQLKTAEDLQGVENSLLKLKNFLAPNMKFIQTNEDIL
jgi:hypothetical protein